MANKYAGTKTEKNLMEAFAGESMARNKYTYFASVAKKAGYEQLAAIFLETADQEKHPVLSDCMVRSCCTDRSRSSHLFSDFPGSL